VILQSLTRHRIETGSADSLARYFAGHDDNPAVLDFPRPGTKAFWRAYSEPLDEFLFAAQHLRDAVGDHDHAGTGPDEPSAGSATTRLNALAEPVGAALFIDADGSFSQRWVSPSLLASLAFMVLQEIGRNARPRECPCGVIFVATRAHRRYCSDRCRERFKKRRQRGRPDREAND
jgi:hypothetical protein